MNSLKPSSVDLVSTPSLCDDQTLHVVSHCGPITTAQRLRPPQVHPVRGALVPQVGADPVVCLDGAARDETADVPIALRQAVVRDAYLWCDARLRGWQPRRRRDPSADRPRGEKTFTSVSATKSPSIRLVSPAPLKLSNHTFWNVAGGGMTVRMPSAMVADSTRAGSWSSNVPRVWKKNSSLREARFGPATVGSSVGSADGSSVGPADGSADGSAVGSLDGSAVSTTGSAVGSTVVASVGVSVGVSVVASVGASVGVSVWARPARRGSRGHPRSSRRGPAAPQSARSRTPRARSPPVEIDHSVGPCAPLGLSRL